MALLSALRVLLLLGGALLVHGATTTLPPTPVTSPAGAGKDLRGKMFTVSRNGGGVAFYPPTHCLDSSAEGSPDWPQATPTGTTPSWSTVSPSPGVSVCVRVLVDFTSGDQNLFTLSPSSTPLDVQVSSSPRVTLTFNKANSVYFSTNFDFLFGPPLSAWGSLCVTINGHRNVVQVFNGSHMSVRKVLQNRFVWSGEPVLKFPGFDGQLSDVQVWDYPLSFQQVYDYMNFSRWSQGSVLSWSSITFYTTGSALLEESFDVLLMKLMDVKDKKEKKKRGMTFRLQNTQQDKHTF